MSNSIQAVDRVLQMLLAFDTGRQELGVSDFAALLGVHKSTASRLAATLEKRGFLERVPGSKIFRLGPELGRLGLLAGSTRSIIELARLAMAKLAADTGETVNLAIRDGAEVVNIAQVDGPHIIGVGSWAGRRTRLHCTSNGKVFLAFGGAPLGDEPLEAVTTNTITSKRRLRAQLEKARQDGWAFTMGELEEGLHAVAVPVFDGSGACVAAVSVSGPAYRMPSSRLPEIARRCQEAAREVSARLGAAGHAI
jgi:IclR family acetate operon transcriptional repressor